MNKIISLILLKKNGVINKEEADIWREQIKINPSLTTLKRD